MATSQQWSDLPADILSIIAKINFPDIQRLRFVCTSWRASLPPPLPKPFSFPLKVPPPHHPNTHLPRAFDDGRYSSKCTHVRADEDVNVIHEETFFRLSPLSHTGDPDPSDGWLFKASQANPNPNTFSHLSMKYVVNYPPGTFPIHLNLLDYRISEVHKCYALGMFTDPGKKRIGFCEIFALWNYVADCEFAAVFFRPDPQSRTEMRVWKLGDTNWTTIDTKGYNDFRKLIVHYGKCYAIDRAGVLGYFDSELNLTVVCSQESDSVILQRYLVEWESDLYMASKDVVPGPLGWPFDVDFVINLNKFDKCNSKWESVRSMGPDSIVFLSENGSFTASARDFKGCSGNRVYVVGVCFDCYYADDNEFGVFDLENGRTGRADETPDYKKIFWPPSWLHV